MPATKTRRRARKARKGEAETALRELLEDYDIPNDEAGVDLLREEKCLITSAATVGRIRTKINKENGQAEEASPEAKAPEPTMLETVPMGGDGASAATLDELLANAPPELRDVLYRLREETTQTMAEYEGLSNILAFVKSADHDRETLLRNQLEQALKLALTGLARPTPSMLLMQE